MMESESRSSYYETGFDYRSLLPTRLVPDAAQQQPSTTSTQPEDVCAWCPEMTWRERLMGCGTCMVAGYLLSLGSFWRMKDLLTGNPLPYVINVTVGNWIALLGSCFLSGPSNQIRRMFQEQRRNATLLYLGSLVLTILVAFWKRLPLQGLWLLLLILVQYISITWYTLSYIPFAQEAVASFLSRYFGRWSNEY